MDSSFSLDKLTNHDKYKTRKEYHDEKRRKDIYLNNKRERSSSYKNFEEGNWKSNKEKRSRNKCNSYGKYKPETDYRENKYKYKPIDVKINVFPNTNRDQNRLEYSKDKYSTHNKQYNSSKKTYSSSLSRDSRNRYKKNYKHTYSTKNSDYSRDRRKNKNQKIKRSHSSSSRSRSILHIKRKDKRRFDHKYKSSRIKYYDDNSSNEKKHKTHNRNKQRDNKKKRSRSTYSQNKHKELSRSYSPDRDHSYSRLGYHRKGKHRYDRKDKKDVRDYSSKSKRKSYSRNYSRSDSLSRSRSASRKSFSSYLRSKNASFTSSSNDSRKNKDEGHYDFRIGKILNNKYKILGLLGDGTFGRCLECLNIEDNIKYGIKVIRPVPRYIESAKYEADIIAEILRADNNNQSKIVKMLEYFYFEEKRQNFIALVFEKLGKSLYDFIKENDYKGFSIEHIQGITKQILEGMAFIHERLKIVHTDLKPENILLKNDEANQIKEKKNWPLENKIQKSKSPSTRSYSREKQDEIYNSPKDIAIKIIDFGGATRENERHSEIINTRQYRAPEVILGSCQWNEKSDVWCLACIFSELYTGELLFPTHNNEEHLSLIEKVSGPIPLWMANNSKKEFRRIFDLDFNGIDDWYKVNFQKIYNKRDEIISNYEKLETVEELIAEQHSVFRDFLKSLLIVDPNKRPSCKDALDHEFFKTQF